MRNQSVRLYLYSSLAIIALTLFWGVRSISKQGELGEKAVRASVEQEMALLTSAVRSSTQAMKYRLLDVLKAEGNDRATRTFQQSPFVAATLLEWDSAQWKMLWHSGKSKNDFRADDIKLWIKDWPLAQIGSDQTYFIKVGDLQGVAYFAVIVPVRKPNNVPMFGVGVFPASQFGLTFSGERTREVRVFDNQGFALALSHPAYLGSSLRRENVVDQALNEGEVNTRLEWKNEAGQPMLALATKMTDSNLYASIESMRTVPGNWKLQSWLFLIIAAAGAIGLNYVLFTQLHRPLMDQLALAEATTEQYRKSALEASSSAPLMSQPLTLDFFENEKGEDGPIPIVTAAETPALATTTLGKVVQMSLRSLDSKIKEYDVKVQTTGLEQIELQMDVLQLQTAVEEVLKNAVEAMQFSEFKWLSVDAEVKDQKVILKVTDSGVGIPEDNLKKVFDPFFSTKDSEGVSRGLGLNVVRRVIEELKGTVAIESHQTATENGTTVTLEWELPVVATAAESAAASAPLESLSIPDDTTDQLADWLKDDDERDELQFTPKLIRKPKVRTLS